MSIHDDLSPWPRSKPVEPDPEVETRVRGHLYGTNAGILPDRDQPLTPRRSTDRARRPQKLLVRPLLGPYTRGRFEAHEAWEPRLGRSPSAWLGALLLMAAFVVGGLAYAAVLRWGVLLLR